jgi:FlaA1/EpsC-like NDP-sugar epimerase
MQIALQDPRVRYVNGEIRDAKNLSRAARGVDAMFHLAALKAWMDTESRSAP